MDKTSYADRYRDTDFRKHPEKYVVGRGEQGVLIAEPYKSEILPYWKFATPEAAATKDGHVRPQDKGSEDSPKAESARIFYDYYTRAKDDAAYQAALKRWKTDGPQ